MQIDATALAYTAVVLALLVWIISRQFAGRFVPTPRRMLVLPLVLCLVGAQQLASAAGDVTALGAAVVGAELVLTALLGAARAACTQLSLRDGFLYQRGGWPVVALWVAMLAARLGLELPFAHTSAGPALLASITLSIGVSLGVQFLVLAGRVRADGRPVRGAATPATLGR